MMTKTVITIAIKFTNKWLIINSNNKNSNNVDGDGDDDDADDVGDGDGHDDDDGGGGDFFNVWLVVMMIMVIMLILLVTKTKLIMMIKRMMRMVMLMMMLLTVMTMMTMMMMLMKNEHDDDDDEDDDVDHEDADDDDGDDDDVIYMMIRRVPKRCAFQSNAFKRVPRGRVPKRGLHPQLPFVKEFVHIFSRRMDNTSKTLQTEEPHGPSRHHQCEEHLVTAILLIDNNNSWESGLHREARSFNFFSKTSYSNDARPDERKKT